MTVMNGGGAPPRDSACVTAPTTAMVLAAGLGTRMRPITERLPKPLVPVAGRPLIDQVLDRLAAAGVREAVVNVHHLADQIEAHLSGRQVPRIRISDERDGLLDTGGGIVRALPMLGPGPFYLANTDSLWIEGARPLLGRLAEAWQDDRMDGLLVLAPTVTASGYGGTGDFLLDTAGRLTRRPERTTAPFAYTGVAILSPRLFDDAPNGRFSLNLLFDRAIATGRLHGLRLDGLWMHVGTPSAIAEAETMIENSVL
jgi:MurNAc alpha-1-phosphate uridylyltransferase